MHRTPHTPATPVTSDTSVTFNTPHTPHTHTHTHTHIHQVHCLLACVFSPCRRRGRGGAPAGSPSGRALERRCGPRRFAPGEGGGAWGAYELYCPGVAASCSAASSAAARCVRTDQPVKTSRPCLHVACLRACLVACLRGCLRAVLSRERPSLSYRWRWRSFHARV